MECCSRLASPFLTSSSYSPLRILPTLSFRDAARLRVSCSSDETGKMSVSVTGATGFIGRRLVQRLQQDNHSVHVLTRSRSKAELIFPVRDFPGIVIAEETKWKDSIHGSDAVVNLAGMPISTRWSPEIKKEIKHSRIRVTSKVVDLINNSPQDVRPSVLVSATAVGYYAVLGEGAIVVLEGQKVVPGKAKELGFRFKYPYVKDALKTIL
ncbi:Epimerase family protein SDR39U1 homolog, chloroplastic [Linum perenne]